MTRTKTWTALFAAAAMALTLAACGANKTDDTSSDAATGGDTSTDTSTDAGTDTGTDTATDGDDAGTDSGTATGSKVVIVSAADPGNLDPQMSVVGAAFELAFYAYDSLLGTNASGEVQAQLAKEWTYEGSTAVFTMNEGITCSDGSELTAQTVADNINWAENPENASPYLGVFLPAGITATADNAAGTVTFELAVPAPFLLETLSNFPIVCDAALADRSLMTSATVGSGPYELVEAAPEDHYTYVRRDGYTWGPGGATTAEAGQPDTVEVRIVANESTAVDLLLAGDVNVVTTVGTDGARAAAAGLSGVEVNALLGESWYNHAEGHPTADQAVRIALTQAVDLDTLASVITGGEGSRTTMMAVVPPTPCIYDATTGYLPTYDPDGVVATMEAAGYTKDGDGLWTKDGAAVVVKFLYDSLLGTTGQAAAELAMEQWQAAGFTIEPSELDTTRLSEVLFGSGDWDIAWEPVNLMSPDQGVGFLSGLTVAEGGANFSEITNEAYTTAMTEALAKTGADSCTSFQAAEQALYQVADFVPWAVRPNMIYYSGTTYEYVGHTQVTTLRVG
ncbi:MAG: ABC transporter substrate-binding protein [Bifidobacteriaceae bacterium]|jgi:peptide/nickel transport system substrate-binding protein|nr:ABC transporter substrate-binding protein [Bifidobacteriaceae bacterium]